jgi:hypothetical protein
VILGISVRSRPGGCQPSESFALYSKQSTILPTKFKSTIAFNQKIAIPQRLTPADAPKIVHYPRAKFRQLINIDGRQSAIIIVTVTDDLPVQSGSKKPGYPSRLDPGEFYLFDAPKNCLKPGKII